ncbi:putative sugar transporter [Sphingobium sp. SYK-6]|uniref:MFS transporter n=1 Tax=Sphingobium sp. (strain NBRC 103272 / SYK-6) TaxID=627192 RepID=UPI0002276BD6|nr:MFS transporter [Sphingobium sp. SYK-6]BAK65494.1 putative sugar transporter [Sphingobium sp. SYK-6]
MPNAVSRADRPANHLLKLLIFLMFAMFAMTTDAVGTVIPEVIREFDLGLTAGGSFQYATMSGIGIAAISLGFLADRIGRKWTILLGLMLFGVGSGLFAAGHSMAFFVVLLFFSGLGIGIFKSGALALIGDLTSSTREHAATMNLVEGFFGVGAIVGPALVAFLLQQQTSWKWIYLIAAMLCAALLVGIALARFPTPVREQAQPADPRDAMRMMSEPTAWFFSIALMLYVGAEAAIYVWVPTYLAGYSGPFPWLALYAVSVFFVLRAMGRFLGAWLLSRLDWSVVLLVCTFGMTVLFWIALAGGPEIAVFALPATGLFMSVLYPTINSTGISCYEKSRHGSIAGLLLFYTCVSAVLAPLAMALLGDWLGDSGYSILLGALFATALTGLCLWNWRRAPFAARLLARNQADYSRAPENPC